MRKTAKIKSKVKERKRKMKQHKITKRIKLREAKRFFKRTLRNI